MKQLILLVLVCLITSCEKRETQINHDKTEIKELKKDSSKIEIADLPVHIDSTDYLIHPIGNVEEYGRRFSSYGSERGYTSFSVANHNGYTINGTLSNLIFQHVNELKTTALTDEIIEISSVTYLEKLRKQTGKNYLIYKIRDTDTNNDSKLNYSDVLSLYISKIDGSEFKKLTPDMSQIIDWDYLEVNNTLYFRYISDTNKNGVFDKSDVISYKFVDFSKPNLKITSYNPIK
ncbi:hypothetical protein Q2T40_14240 [Winogradskyella maritima]|uniref:Lipoprotein n=1 Tax=Winogradskyella maritima TaxID=1517766 RepID=A0ABV8AHA5_9FLAO|nr:hypothetical protein [Winogradskyella maritima]